MNRLLFIVAVIALFGFNGCKKDVAIQPYLDGFDSHQYYAKDPLPEEYQGLYGKWEYVHTQGGGRGGGISRTLDEYDEIVFQKYGIFGLFKNDEMVNYGKLKVNDNGNRFGPAFIFKPELEWVGDYSLTLSPQYISIDDSSFTMHRDRDDGSSYYYKRIK